MDPSIQLKGLHLSIEGVGEICAQTLGLILVEHIAVSHVLVRTIKNFNPHGNAPQEVAWTLQGS
ncbi:MAG: hypothetical protein IKR71_02335 [Bacteroidales bacterium]|nr:hypothetical protein [Bacteroidales bacterium]